MKTVTLVLWFEGDSLEQAGIYSRDVLEDPLRQALETSGLGRISGGGGGDRGSNIDIELEKEEQTDAAIELIRRVLKAHGAPLNTTLTKYVTFETEYRLFDPST